MRFYKLGLVVFSMFLLNACSTTGEEYESNAYSSSQVNERQNASMIDIIAILPAKIQVDNSQQQSNATKGGGVLGAVAGGLIGNGHGKSGATVGALLGGVAGALAGSSVSGKTLVEGVTLSYKQNGQLYTSTQVGKVCMFKMGTALVVTTKANETRVQPNANCPES